MSNNPPLPPPNMDDFEATMIREKNPLPETSPVVFGTSDQPPAEPAADHEGWSDWKEWDGSVDDSRSFDRVLSSSEISATYKGTSKTPEPRRAKPRNDIWTYIALGAWFAVAGFIGAFLGTVLANIL